MADFQKLKHQLRVRGTAHIWFGRCSMALARGGFRVLRDDMRLNTFEARYQGITIDGSLRVTLEERGDKVEIQILATADCDNVFAWFIDPRKRILNAFTTNL